MPKEIEGVLKYRKSELLEYYIKFYSEAELNAVIKNSKLFENKDLNFFIKQKFIELDELILYCEEREEKIAELQAIIDSLTGIPGQEEDLNIAIQNLHDYIEAEPYEFTLTLVLNEKFRIDRSQVLENGEIPLSEMTKFLGSKFINCIIGPDSTFELQDLSNIVFQGCTINGGNVFDGCDLYKTNFTNSNLKNVNFDLIKDPRKVPLEKEDKFNHMHPHEPRPYDGWMEVLHEPIDSFDYPYLAALSYINFEGATINNCVLNNKEIICINLKNASIIDCVINKISIRDVYFENTKFINTTITNSKFIQYGNKGSIQFTNCNITNNHLINITVNTSDFTKGTYSKNWLGQCNLNNCVFNGLDLSNTGIQYSTLKNCSFINTDLNEFSFAYSKLQFCDLSEIRFEPLCSPNFKVTELNNVIFSDNIFLGFSNFFHSLLKDIVFTNIDFTFTKFSSATLSNVRFRNCKLNGVCSTESIITDAQFDNCEIRGVKFNFSNFNNTQFNDSDLSGTEFLSVLKTNTTINNCDIHGILES